MAHIAERALDELRELRGKRELTVDEFTIVLPDDAHSSQWRLHRLAAHNYRGLTEWEGKP